MQSIFFKDPRKNFKLFNEIVSFDNVLQTPFSLRNYAKPAVSSHHVPISELRHCILWSPMSWGFVFARLVRNRYVDWRVRLRQKSLNNVFVSSTKTRFLRGWCSTTLSEKRIKGLAVSRKMLFFPAVIIAKRHCSDIIVGIPLRRQVTPCN